MYVHVFCMYFVCIGMHICMYLVHMCIYMYVLYVSMRLAIFVAENTDKYIQYIQIYTRYIQDTYKNTGKIQVKYISSYRMYCMYLYVSVCIMYVY